MHRPFRFGVQAHGAMDAKRWASYAQRVEDLGYATLSLPDHFDDQMAPGPALAVAAAATTRLRLGVLMYCNDFRHPVVTAKEAATVDLLSDGRLELGIGAGWKTADYAGAGLALDRPAVRIARLAESVEVIKALFADGPVTHHGDHYRVDGLEGLPKPVQRPHPPIVIGGGGQKVLSLAARAADIVGINVNLASGVIGPDAGPNATDDATTEKIGWIRDAAGDRFGELELQTRVHIAEVTDDRNALAEAVAPALGISPAASLASPHALAGSVEQICDDLMQRRERWGISYITWSDDALDSFAPVVDRLAGT